MISALGVIRNEKTKQNKTKNKKNKNKKNEKQKSSVCSRLRPELELNIFINK